MAQATPTPLTATGLHWRCTVEAVLIVLGTFLAVKYWQVVLPVAALLILTWWLG